MSATETTGTATSARTASTPKDVRGYWRVLLAIIAPLPMLALAVYYAFLPAPSRDPFADRVSAWGTHQSTYAALQWFDAAFVVLIVPATFAVIWVARRGAPRLTTWGAMLSLTGFLAGIALNTNDDLLAYTTAAKHLDVNTMSKLYDSLESNPTVGLGGLLFILGLTIGLLLLGIALWRSHAAPAWMGVALAFGGLTHPFMPGHVAVAAGLVIAAIGFSGASSALLRMRSHDFDLPPTP